MKQRSLARWIRFSVVLLALVGLLIYAVALPSYGQSLVDEYPEFSGRYLPWLIFLIGSGVPCYAVLALLWILAGNLGRGAEFSLRNAKLLHLIAWLCAADTVYFLGGNTLYWFLNLSHPGVWLLSFTVVFIGVSLTVAAAVLANLAQKAAELKTQTDLTI